MNAQHIESRYRIDSEAARTDETTTWYADDIWLDTPVLLVTPQPGSEQRFDDITSCLRQRPSPHLIAVYDATVSAFPFAVHSRPGSTVAEWTHPCDEADVLALGSALAAGLASMHAAGLTHGHLHPGCVAIDEAGQTLLSPWPLAPPPPGWEGLPGELGADPDHDTGRVGG